MSSVRLATIYILVSSLFLFFRSGVNVPGLRFVDAIEGLLGIEWIEGKSIKYLLPSGAQEEFEDEGEGEGENEVDLDDTLYVVDEDPLKEFGISVGMSYLYNTHDNFQNDIYIYTYSLLDVLMGLIGVELAKMHIADIIHGDLTTSNMMLRHPSSFHSQDATIPTEVVCSTLFIMSFPQF